MCDNSRSVSYTHISIISDSVGMVVVIQLCKLCSVGELSEQLDCKSMEMKWYKYTKVES